MSFLSTNQQCQSTEGNSKHWPQPGRATHWPHPFVIHHRTPEGWGTVPFTPQCLEIRGYKTRQASLSERPCSFECRQRQNPPPIVKLVLEAVCIMLSIKPDRKPDPSSVKLLGDMKFLDRLRLYDKDNIPPAVMQKIRQKSVQLLLIVFAYHRHSDSLRSLYFIRAFRPHRSTT